MNTRMVKTFVLGALAALAVSPALAQVRADLGPLHIRIASDAPPRARVERRPARPNRSAVWIDGSWDRQDDRWEWLSGRWEQPSDRHARWMKAKYRRDNGAWRYEPAHWSNQQVVEGDDYRQWKADHHSGHDRR